MQFVQAGKLFSDASTCNTRNILQLKGGTRNRYIFDKCNGESNHFMNRKSFFFSVFKYYTFCFPYQLIIATFTLFFFQMSISVFMSKDLYGFKIITFTFSLQNQTGKLLGRQFSEGQAND